MVGSGQCALSKLVMFGKLPVSLQGGVGYWMESPDNGPEGCASACRRILCCQDSNRCYEDASATDNIPGPVLRLAEKPVLAETQGNRSDEVSIMKCSINDTGRRLRTMSSAICLAAAFALPAQGETLDTKIGKLDFEAGYPTPEPSRSSMTSWTSSAPFRPISGHCRWRPTGPWRTPMGTGCGQPYGDRCR
jgi:hypothetical protein